MTTFCSTCGSSLATDVRFCPQCGTPTSSYDSNSAASPYDPTAASFRSGAPQHKPATDYGSPPYGVLPQNPYETLNPYEAPLRPPPPPPLQRQVKIGLLIGTVVLVLVLVSGGVVFLIQGTKGNTSRQTPMETATPAQPSVTATATQTPQDIYNQATSGKPVVDESLSTNDTGRWAVWNDSNGACLFTAGAYHAIIRPAFSGAIGCFARSTNFSNLAYQVEMTIIKGGGGGGLLFRNGSGPDPSGFGYQFVVDRNHVDLHYHETYFSWSTAIKANLNQTYLLTAIARGKTINVYVDKQWIGSTEDNAASSGSIGLEVIGQLNFTEVVFRNVKVWTLS